MSYTEFTDDHPQVIGGSNLDISKAAFATAFVNRTEFLQRYQANTSAASFVDAILESLRGAVGVDLEGERETLIDRYNVGTTLNESRVLVMQDIAENETFAAAAYNPSLCGLNTPAI